MKEIDKHFSRQEFRRASWNEVGEITYSARTAETYVRRPSRRRSTSSAIRTRGFRIVVDYAFSAASLILPLVLGALDVEAVASHALRQRAAPGGRDGRRSPSRSGRRSGSSTAVGADLGVVLDPAAERIFLVDDKAREVPVEQELLLFLRLLASDGKRGRLAFPTTVTSLVDELVAGHRARGPSARRHRSRR